MLNSSGPRFRAHRTRCNGADAALGPGWYSYDDGSTHRADELLELVGGGGHHRQGAVRFSEGDASGSSWRRADGRTRAAAVRRAGRRDFDLGERDGDGQSCSVKMARRRSATACPLVMSDAPPRGEPHGITRRPVAETKVRWSPRDPSQRTLNVGTVVRPSSGSRWTGAAPTGLVAPESGTSKPQTHG